MKYTIKIFLEYFVACCKPKKNFYKKNLNQQQPLKAISSELICKNQSVSATDLLTNYSKPQHPQLTN